MFKEASIDVKEGPLFKRANRPSAGYFLRACY